MFGPSREGTDPKSSDSVFEVTNVEVPLSGDSVILSWSGVSHKQSTGWCGTNLLTGFSGLSNNIPATPPIDTCAGTAEEINHKFYRIQVQP